VMASNAVLRENGGDLLGEVNVFRPSLLST